MTLHYIEYYFILNSNSSFFWQNEHVHKAHEMFRKANRVSRPDKALILGFMAGLRENPRPNSENVLVIKLGETEVSSL